jgi:hypothetical protein
MFRLIEPSSSQVQNIVLVHSVSAHIMGSHMVYKIILTLNIMFNSISLLHRLMELNVITMCCMRIVCWIPKATNTHSKHVIVNAFSPQEWLHERASMLRYRPTHFACFDSVYTVHKRSKQERQCAYNVIFWHVHVTTVEKNNDIFSVFCYISLSKV